MNSGDYYRDEAGNTARAAWIDLLIDKQQSNGNWPIYNPDQENDGSGSQLGGVDVCAMALQALAPSISTQVSSTVWAQRTAMKICRAL